MSHYKVKFVPNTPNHCWNKAFDLIKDDTEVLDIGCSAGDFGRALIEFKKCRVDGIEPDHGDAVKARKFLRNVYEGFVEEILANELKSKKYDHIVFLDVIEHIYDPITVLEKVKQHLNPGGTIVFSIPNMAHISVRLMLLKGDFEYGHTGLLDNTHLHFYTRREIERVFASAGMEVEVWDFTEAVYPEDLIRSELTKLGLSANSEAMELLKGEQAQIFQFVGAAAPTKQKMNVERIEYSPDPQGQISKEYESRISDLELQLNETRQSLKLAEGEVTDLKVKLTDEDFLALQVRLHKYAKNYVKKKLSR